MKAWTSICNRIIALCFTAIAWRSHARRWLAILLAACWVAGARGENLPLSGHPRLYFTAAELEGLRAAHGTPPRDQIWKNLIASADWCSQQPPRTAWIPSVPDDPQFENLYDRFYAAMHDLAIIETLAFASALHDPGADPYFKNAHDWLLAGAEVWRHEADNP